MKLKSRMILLLLVAPKILLADYEADAGGNEHKNVEVILNRDAGEEPIQLKARHARLNQVFDAIANATGVKVHYSNIPDEFVSVNCAGETLKQVLECLLGSEADMIFRYPDKVATRVTEANPVELWVLNSNFGSALAHIQHESAVQCSSATSAKSAKQQNFEQAEKEKELARHNETERLVSLAAANDPTQRSQALSQLVAQGDVDNPEVRKALQSALSDEDPAVRAQAVNGWARINGAAASTVLQEALHDSDASVRLMAVDNAGNDVGLLQQALNDSDASVREFAAIKLEDFANQNKGE